MHRHDGAGAIGNGRFKALRIEIQRFRIDIDKDYLGPHIQNGIPSGNPGDRRRNHFVTRFHAHLDEAQVQGGGTGGDAHRVWRGNRIRKGLLERADLRSGREPTAAQGFDYRVFLLETQVGTAQRDEARGHRFAALIHGSGHQFLHAMDVEVAGIEGINGAVFEELADFFNSLVNRPLAGETEALPDLGELYAEISEIVIIPRHFNVYAGKSARHALRQIDDPRVVDIHAGIKNLAVHLFRRGFQHRHHAAGRITHMHKGPPLVAAAAHLDKAISHSVSHHLIDGKVETHPARPAERRGDARHDGFEMIIAHFKQGAFRGQLALAEGGHGISGAFLVEQFEDAAAVYRARRSEHKAPHTVLNSQLGEFDRTFNVDIRRHFGVQIAGGIVG